MIDNMFALYGRHYDGTSEQLFRSDLSSKQYVIILSDDTGRLQGFSTAAVTEHQFQGRQLRSFFSGDTVIDEKYWGEQALPIAWFRLTGRIKAEIPDIPLYWFLLVKGHRTYRYLRAFFKEYCPAHDRETPPQYKALMDMLAADRFGDAYDGSQGVISFPTSHGHLKPAFASIPAKDSSKPDVVFFLQRNPGYVRGDELVCLVELSPSNLHSRAERQFRIGMEQHESLPG